MDNIIGLFVAIMVAMIVTYNVVLPTFNSSVVTANNTATHNMTAGNFALTNVIPTLIITTVVVFVVRGMLA